MNRIVHISLLIMVLLGSVAAYSPKLSAASEQRTIPTVVQGVLDLTDWDFQRDGAVFLNGEWAFYWNELLLEPPGAIQASNNLQFVPVPSVWNQYKIGGKRLPGQGYATYQLKIKMPDNHGRAALKIIGMSTAYQVVVNGEAVGSNGIVAANVYESQGEFRPQVIVMPETAGDYEVLIQVSNYLYDRGGMWYPMILGSEEQMLRKQTIGVAQDLFLSGVLLMIGLYHIGIYLMRRWSKPDLVFGLACLIVAWRSVFTGERFAIHLFPQIDIHLTEFMDYMTYFWGMFLFLLFIRLFYPKESSALFVKVQFAVTVIFTSIVILFPMPIYSAMINVFHSFMFISCLYAVSVLIRAAMRRKSGALTHIFSISFFILTVLHDILYNAALIYFIPVQMVPFGLCLFVFSQAFISARRHSYEYHFIRNMSDKLQSLDRLKDEFLAHTSHELKTPLHGIQNISQLMLEGKSGKLNPVQQSNLEVVVSTTRRLTHLINDILDFSRLKHMETVLYRKPTNLHTVIASSVDVFRYFIVGKPLRLQTKLADDLPAVWADENRLTQILFNLIGNAIKFTERGEVVIRAVRHGDMIEISVQDTGIGIPQDKQATIFQSFEQAGTAGDMEQGGTGLGLNISQKLVELHGGSMWVESRVGHGSTFFFTIPVSQEEIGDSSFPQRQIVDGESHSQQEYPDAQEWNDTLIAPIAAASESPILDQVNDRIDRITILAVDDEVTNLLVLQNAFSDRHSRVLTATSGKSALQIIEQHRRHIDLIILDVMMPGMSGLEVCRQIREDYAISELPILLVTAQNQPLDVQAGFAAGANDYLTKPFDLTELRARAGTLLELKKSINELMKSQMDFLQAQIKPHFLYNTLNTIVSFCRYDAAKAAELLVELSNYLRGSFDLQNRETFVPLHREIELVQSYLAIEQARYGEKLSFSMDIAPLNGNYQVPPLIIQPLVENAVRHGLSHKRDGGTIKVHIAEQDDRLLIRVQDDGVGIAADRLRAIVERRTERVGVGIANINHRLQGFYGHGLTIESELGQGTTATVQIPRQTEVEGE